jgi:DNA polymerase-3 subunit epsilon
MMATNEQIFRRDRNEAISTAKEIVNRNAIILDTETTGLGEKDEIIEISIIDMTGKVLLDSLVKPTLLIPPESTAIHGISNMNISRSPYITQLLPQLTKILQNNYVTIYNSEFDLRILNQSLRSHRVQPPRVFQTRIYCAMRLYSRYNGDWDEVRQCYRWKKLGEALGIQAPDNIHRAIIDAELTRQIILTIAGLR